MSDPADFELTALPPEVRAAFEAERAARRALEAHVAENGGAKVDHGSGVMVALRAE